MSEESKVPADSKVAVAAVVAEEAVKLTKDKSECPVDSVTVFSDRAEVTRLINLELEAAGDYEVLVEDLPGCVDPDSVRVNGTGHVVLREVSYGVHHKVVARVVATDDNAESAEVLQSSLESLKTEQEALNTRVTEVQRSKSLLKAYTDSALQRANAADREASSAEALAACMEFAFNLMERSQAKLREYNNQVAELQGQIEAKSKLITVTTAKLSNLLGHRHDRPVTKQSRDVTVAISASQPGNVQLKLMYMVSRASWKPAYDARIQSNDTTLSLTYYGMVQQSTGEDWGNTKLVLSTATPAVGGSAPVLPTKHVTFQPVLRAQAISLRDESESFNVRRHARRGGGFARNMQMQAFAMPVAAAAAPPPPAAVATSKVESSGAATTFHVERRTTIASDNKPHKTTVAILELASSFRHYSVPALNAVAYLQAMTTNTSAYTLLASKQVNVFVDNSFVSKTQLNVVAPGETFRTFLGVDKAVKVTYRPISNVHSERGYFSKTEGVVYKYVTIVKNTKSRPISMVVADMLPVSDDTTIKVKLIQPTREEVDRGTAEEAKQKAEQAARAEAVARGSGAGAAGAGAGAPAPQSLVTQVKATNNLVWTRPLEPGASVEIPFEYAIEHPSGRNTVTYNRHPR